MRNDLKSTRIDQNLPRLNHPEIDQHQLKSIKNDPEIYLNQHIDPITTQIKMKSTKIRLGNDQNLLRIYLKT